MSQEAPQGQTRHAPPDSPDKDASSREFVRDAIGIQATPPAHRFLDAPWLDRDQALADYWRRHPIDRFGDRIHLALACFYALLVGAPISYMESAGLFPLGCLVFRLPFIWRGVWRPALTPLPLAILAWFTWSFFTLLWSPDRAAGWDDHDTIRYLLITLAIWPVMHHRHTLILCIAIGFLAGNAAQLANYLGVKRGSELGLEWLAMYPFDTRNGGWWPAVPGGEMLVGALGLHLPVVLMGKGRWRALAILASLITIAGLIATGTRGAWIAAAGMTLIALGITLAQLPTRAARLRAVAITAVACTILSAGVWAFAGDMVKQRFGAIITETQRVIDEKDFDSDNGVRIALALWAWEAFTEHPIAGVGAGGFTQYVNDHAARRPDAHARLIEGRATHAHNAPLHALATTGVIGGALLAAVVTLALMNAWRCARIGADGQSQWGTYHAGPFFALVGMTLVMPFDIVLCSAQPAAVFFLMCALCPWWIPPRKERAVTPR
jgi:O-antigen ligase